MNARKRSALLTVSALVLCAIVVIGIVVMVRSQQARHGVDSAESVGSRQAPGGDEQLRNAGSASGLAPDVDGTDGGATASGTVRARTGYSIAGRVVYEDGKGVAGAEVLVCHELSYATYSHPVAKKVTTDDAGHFLAEDVPREHLFLTASKENYCFFIPGPEINRGPLIAYPVYCRPERDSVTGLRLVLRPGGVLAGVVVDSEGQPVPEAIVTVGGGWHLATRMTVDDEGRFRASSLVPGEYRVGAAAEGFLTTSSDDLVRTNQENLVLRLERGRLVEGTVVSAESGEPVPGAKVVASADRSYAGPQGTFPVTVQVSSAVTDAAGHFRILICPNEETTLVASWEDWFSEEGEIVRVDDGGYAGPVTIELVQWCTVSGIVLEEATDKPLAGVRLFASSHPRAVPDTVSGQDGRFTIKGLSPGRTYLMPLSRQYKFVDPDTHLGTKGLFVSAPSSGLEVRLTREVEVSGTVVNEEGRPVSGATVIPRLQDGEWSNEGEGSTSDGDGRFVVREEYWGRISGLLVTHPEYAHKFIEIDPEELARSEQEVRVVLDRGGSISGSARDSSGDPRPGVSVKLVLLGDPLTSTDDSLELKSTVTDKEGHYSFAGVAEGSYRVEATFGERTAGQSRQVTMTAANSIEGVDLVVPVAGHIAGRVQDDLGRPLGGMWLRIEGVGWPELSVTTGPDGAYHFDDLVEGAEYELTLDPYVDLRPRYKYLEPRTVTASADDVDFVVEPIEFGSIRGFVYRGADGSPVTRFYLTVSPAKDGDQTPARMPQRDKECRSEDGSFRCTDLAPGSYRILVVPPGLPDVVLEPVEVTAGAETVRDIYVDEGGLIRGKVVDEAGLPVVGAGVKARDFGSIGGRDRKYTLSDYYGRESETDDSGEFELPHLTSGKASFRVTHPEYATLEMEETVAEGETTDVGVLQLEKGALIHGYFKDLDGRLRDRMVLELTSVDRRYRASTQTDANGMYRFEHVTHGTHFLATRYMDGCLKVEIDGETDKEVNLDFTEAGTVSGKVVVPPSEDRSKLVISLRVEYETPSPPSGRRRQVEFQADEPFEIDGLLPGKYKLVLTAYRSSDNGKRTRLEVKTEPEEIVVEISAKEHVKQEVRVTDFEERAGQPGSRTQ